MYTILCYDVQSKRTGRVLKIARKYLYSTQRSLLEGHLTSAQLERLKRELVQILVPDEDFVRIFTVNSSSVFDIHQLGKVNTNNTGFL